MLTGVTVSCFLLSYLLTLVFEFGRLVVKLPGRHILPLVMLGLGIFAHSVYLFNHLYSEPLVGAQPQLLSSWFQWITLGAWGLAFAYLVLLIRNPQTSVGLFLAPLILLVLWLALSLRNAAPFQPETTVSLWRSIHGVSLLVGTMFICFGLAFGAMYLFQSHRLKSRLPKWKFIRLPALEFLQSMNRMSLFVSVLGLGMGLISGIVLNLNQKGHIAWFSSGIVVSVALFVWSLAAAVMEIRSRSLGGRRAAYLAIANFVFMIVVLALVLFSSHAQGEKQVESDSRPNTTAEGA